MRDARDDVFEDGDGGVGDGGDSVVARRAGVIAPYQRARTAMEHRPYPVGRVGCACGCRMVDVAKVGVRRGGDE